VLEERLPEDAVADAGVPLILRDALAGLLDPAQAWVFAEELDRACGSPK
jgi:hypothetical protein